MNGVVYIAYGPKAKKECELSVKSLKQHNPGLPITVIDESKFSDPGPGARWAKLNIDQLVEYDNILYLDADTRALGDLSAGFEILNDWDLAIAPSKNQDGAIFAHIRNEAEKQVTLDEIGNPWPLQLQAGVMFVARERCARLFAEWRKQWQRYKDQDQAALLRALDICPVRLWLLGRDWNGGSLVEHRFGACR